jgi:hypothetical protein
MSVGNLARVVAVLAACLAAAGSATSTSNSSQNQSTSQVAANTQNSPPPPQQMDASRALGVWRSTFGAVKIEADNSQGGLSAGNLHGVWVYQRQGQEVIGYFSGNLRGNVLQFHWQEPNNPPLTGEGYLVFDVQGRQYSGRWWSDKRDRVGDWNGWRQPGPQQRDQADPYGGQGNGEDQPQPQPYRRQPYRPYQQQQPYQQQPYQPQPNQPQPYQPQPSQRQPAPPPQTQPTYYN